MSTRRSAAAKPVPGPLKPLIAIPTTAGTGSETTGVAIFDLVERKAKTGIAHRYLRPTLGHRRSRQYAHDAAGGRGLDGLDVLSHALESYTAHSVRQPAAAGASDPAAGVSRRQPDQRYLGAASAAKLLREYPAASRG